MMERIEFASLSMISVFFLDSTDFFALPALRLKTKSLEIAFRPTFSFLFFFLFPAGACSAVEYNKMHTEVRKKKKMRLFLNELPYLPCSLVWAGQALTDNFRGFFPRI